MCTACSVYTCVNIAGLDKIQGQLFHCNGGFEHTDGITDDG